MIEKANNKDSEIDSKIIILNNILSSLKDLPQRKRIVIVNVLVKLFELEEPTKNMIDKVYQDLRELPYESSINLLESVLTFYGIEKYKDLNSESDQPDF